MINSIRGITQNTGITTNYSEASQAEGNIQYYSIVSLLKYFKAKCLLLPNIKVYFSNNKSNSAKMTRSQIQNFQCDWYVTKTLRLLVNNFCFDFAVAKSFAEKCQRLQSTFQDSPKQLNICLSDPFSQPPFYGSDRLSIYLEVTHAAPDIMAIGASSTLASPLP